MPYQRPLIKSVITVIVVIWIVALFVYIVVAYFAPKIEESEKQQRGTLPFYRQMICDDAWAHPVSHENDNVDHFTIQLGEGCYSAPVTLPNSWRGWSYQHAPGSPDGWVALWYSGANPIGPLPIDDNGATKGWSVEKRVRVQGKGVLLFYRTDK